MLCLLSAGSLLAGSWVPVLAADLRRLELVDGRLIG